MHGAPPDGVSCLVLQVFIFMSVLINPRYLNSHVYILWKSQNVKYALHKNKNLATKMFTVLILKHENLKHFILKQQQEKGLMQIFI